MCVRKQVHVFYSHLEILSLLNFHSITSKVQDPLVDVMGVVTIS